MNTQFVAILLPICIFGSALAQSDGLRIDPSVQRSRDEERFQVLTAELNAERGALQRANAALAAGVTNELAAQAHRHSENVKALQREIAALRTDPQNQRLRVRPKGTAKVPSENPSAARVKRTARFWDPYNRTSN